MAISGALLTKVNNALADIAARIEAREAIYFANNGKYWQGIRTPSIIPIDGADTVPNLTLHPTDQVEDWNGVTLPANIPLAIAVVVHHGPLGWGYTEMALARVSADGLYIRSRGIGAYGVTTVGWDKVPDVT